MEKILEKNKSLGMGSEEFRKAGHLLVERVANFLEELPEKKVTTGERPSVIRSLINNVEIPLSGEDTMDILIDSTNLLFEHSLFNGHPRFWGYITSSAAPIGALADFVASSLNANVGAFALSPVATEIELQTVRWLAQLIGYDENCGGLFVSGGNMANFSGFLAARRHKIRNDIRKEGLSKSFEKKQLPWGVFVDDIPPVDEKRRYTIYCAKGTHTWIEKAADLFGFGTNSIRWINNNETQQMDLIHLKKQIKEDIRYGHTPFLVVANAGSVGSGTVDALSEIASICRAEDLWFHVDGAYGAPAAMLPEMRDLFKGLDEADSIALDPHKWLYSPLEAGCILVRNRNHLEDTFSFNPNYYNFNEYGEETPVNFHGYGMQNSRGFKALKVWLSLKQVGKNGLSDMIRKDIALAKALYLLVEETPFLEAVTWNLSITTFRYVPKDMPDINTTEYVNTLNEILLKRLQTGGEVFPSNAVINGNYCLRVCIVNFRTEYSHLEELVEIVLREGRKIAAEMLLLHQQ
jgi:aromatic-L-amino-acid/L-tryptophan decarboxylase